MPAVRTACLHGGPSDGTRFAPGPRWPRRITVPDPPPENLFYSPFLTVGADPGAPARRSVYVLDAAGREYVYSGPAPDPEP